MPDITARVAHYIRHERTATVPLSALEKAKDCLLDHLGACFVGSTTRASELTNGLIQTLLPAGNCPLIGTDVQSSVLGAVWGNGVSASAWDYDDGHRAPLRRDIAGESLGQAAGHPGVAVIPSALAFGIEGSSSGVRLLESIVVGYEVGVRIAASRRPATVLANVTGNWGTFAAAVAGGKILGLESESLENVIGLAAGSLLNPPRRISLVNMTMIKESVGWAGMTGAVACFMAQAGITGLREVLDNPGFFEGAYFDDLGKNYVILDVYFKPYSSCRMMHPALDAALALKRSHGIEVGDIGEILVETSLKAAGMINPQPETIEEAQFSIPFCVATILRYERVTPEVMGSSHLRDRETLDLSGKVRVTTDKPQGGNPEEARFPRKTAARVTIRAGRGNYSVYVDTPKGDPEDPLTRGEVIDKFREASLERAGGRGVEELLDFVLNLEKKKSLRELTPLLRVKGGTTS